MGLTFAEFLAMPKDMSFEEYDKLLGNKRRLEKRIGKLSEDIDSEEDSLEILTDETGSERYNKHLTALNKAKASRERAQKKLETIKARLG